MNPKIQLTEENNAWAWFVKFGAETLGGGYGATKGDAANDASIFARNLPAVDVDAKDAPAFIECDAHEDAVSVTLCNTSNGQSMERIGYYETLKDGSFYCLCYNDDVITRNESEVRQWLIDHV